MILSYIWNYFNDELVFPDFTQLFLFCHASWSSYVCIRPGCIRSVPPASSSFFAPLPAVLTCERHQFGAINLPKIFSVCVHACVTAMWLNGKPRGIGGYAHRDLWPAPHLAGCSLQLSSLRLSAPPFNACRQSTHTPDASIPIQRHARMLCIPIHPLRNKPLPEDKLYTLNNIMLTIDFMLYSVKTCQYGKCWSYMCKVIWVHV